MPEAGLKRLPDWIVIGQEAWDEVERRNQLLVRALAARNPQARFLFAEQPLRPREARRWRWPRPRQVAANIWSLQTIRPIPDGVSARTADRFEAAQVRRAARRVGLERPWLWTQDPRAGALVDELGLAGVLYDLTDDWAAFETDPARRAAMQASIERLGARADVVLACSRTLEEGARAWTDRVRYLPNAVTPPPADAAVPAELLTLPGPRLGYAGTLHSSRLDVGLVCAAAALRPSWSFVFVGPNLLKVEDRGRLTICPNVHLLGARPHAEVHGYLRGFDVCLLPNIVNDFTRSLDPLKLYEYLAAGRPVITTPVANAPDLQEYLSVVATAEGLVIEAERLISEDDEARQAARRAAVADETWDARAGEVEAALNVTAPAAAELDVSVVIVSYNTRELLERCLLALREQDGPSTEVIVVDNASSDGSPELVRERFPEVRLIEAGGNLGFARANNLAFEQCRGRYVLLLNSDAFLHDDALRELLAVAERHSEAGAVGPRLLNPDGTLQRSAWPFPSAPRLALEALGLHRLGRRMRVMEDLALWAHDEERIVDFLIGACLLMPREALALAGGFDEEFWLYGEEADLQRRLADRGYSTVLAPRATATHVGSASSQDSVTRLEHFYTGQMRFLRKHGGPLAWPVARLALLAGSVLRGRWGAARVAVALRRPPGA